MRAGAIQPTIAIDLERCGLGGTAILSIACDQDRAGEVAEALARRPEARFVATTIGEQDVLAEVIVAPGTELTQLVNADLARVQGIQRIYCARVLRTHKASHDWTFPVLGEAAEWEDVEATSGSKPGPLLSLDELDRRLMAILQLDCRASFPRLAEETGSSESVVRRRVELLIDSGAIRALGLVDARYLGYQCEFFLRLRTELSHLQKAVTHLVSAGPVRYLSATSNVGELLAEVVLPAQTDMLAFYESTLGLLPGLTEAAVSIEGRILKRGFARMPGGDPRDTSR